MVKKQMIIKNEGRIEEVWESKWGNVTRDIENHQSCPYGNLVNKLGEQNNVYIIF